MVAVYVFRDIQCVIKQAEDAVSIQRMLLLFRGFLLRQLILLNDALIEHDFPVILQSRCLLELLKLGAGKFQGRSQCRAKGRAPETTRRRHFAANQHAAADAAAGAPVEGAAGQPTTETAPTAPPAATSTPPGA